MSIRSTLEALCLACLLEAAACADPAPLEPPGEAQEETKNDWCAEHGLPESQCTRCNPALVPAFLAKGDFCRDHGYPASVCPVCRGTTPFPPEEMRVRLASATTAREAGIETTRAARRPFGATLEVVGTLAFDSNARAELSVPEEAVVETVHVDVGDRARKGDPLVTLRSASVGARRADLDAARTALATAQERLARERRLFEKGLASKGDLEAAERAHAAARAALDTARAALAASGATAAGNGAWILRAPFEGAVIERRAIAGHAAPPGEPLVAIADPRRIRAELAIPEDSASLVRPGQRTILHLPGGEIREASLTAVGAAVDPRTRTIPARVALKNEEGALKGGAFVRARIHVGAAEDAVVIPTAAVQRVEGRAIVFVQEADATFRPVAVTLGPAVGGEVAVTSGLAGGETIVTTGAFLLATETRKDAIGAGCCEVE